VKCIGLMSGTSCDGLDIAYCTFSTPEKAPINYKIELAETIEYPKEIVSKLKTAETFSLLDFLLFDRQYGDYLGLQVRQFLTKHNLPNPKFIASHGHTIFHQPDKKLTVQIGNPSNVSGSSDLNVVGDFRSVDVALGGQGAPLVPIGDKLLFTEYDFCLNLGGIANISFDQENRRTAFDICPMNMTLNFLVEKIGHEFDKDGEIARTGKVIPELISSLEKLPYFTMEGAKSLGKEWIYAEFIPEIMKHKDASVEDLLATVVEFGCNMISRVVLNKCKDKITRMLVTGGGAFNKFFIERLQNILKGKCEVVVPDSLIVKYKEALIFAFLGLLRWNNKVNCLKSATGAKKDNIGGVIVIAKS